MNFYVILFKTTFFFENVFIHGFYSASINTKVKMLNYAFWPSVFNNADFHVKKKKSVSVVKYCVFFSFP